MRLPRTGSECGLNIRDPTLGNATRRDIKAETCQEQVTRTSYRMRPLPTP